MTNNQNNISAVNDDSRIVLYQPTETLSLQVRLERETVWLNRQQIAKLFDRDVKTIGKHINNALKEELAQEATVAKFATVQIEGDREVMRQVEHYNLDVILSVGYRVKSGRGVQFRRWANAVLRRYLLQGYSVNRHLIALQENMDKRMSRMLVVNFWTRRKSPYLSRKKREQCTAAKTWRDSMLNTRASGCRVG